jgi:hypothetical protein
VGGGGKVEMECRISQAAPNNSFCPFHHETSSTSSNEEEFQPVQVPYIGITRRSISRDSQFVRV